MCFSYYGLAVWFPDMIKHLQNEEYESKVKNFHGEKIENFHFNFSLENQIHQDGKYINDKFVASTRRRIQMLLRMNEQEESDVCGCVCLCFVLT